MNSPSLSNPNKHSNKTIEATRTSVKKFPKTTNVRRFRESGIIQTQRMDLFTAVFLNIT